MGAGAEGHARVHAQHGAAGLILLPAGHNGQALANVHGVVVLLPGSLPILLLHALGVQGVGHFAAVQPVLQQGQHLGGRLVRREVHMHDDLIPGLVQQILLNQVHMGNGFHLGFQVAVILNVNSAAGNAGGNGLSLFGAGLRHSDADIGPFHPGSSQKRPRCPPGGAAGCFFRFGPAAHPPEFRYRDSISYSPLKWYNKVGKVAAFPARFPLCGSSPDSFQRGAVP